MASPSRSTQFSKLHKVLKKRFEAVAADANRTVFEQMVFACCLENAHYDKAEEAFAALEHNFFDWNEIRVSTVRELCDVFGCLPQPPAAANRVKRVLQSIFESSYSFDLEELGKKNLGPAVEHLKKLDGTSRFSVAYVTQASLGGHAIPIDAGAVGALHVVELVSEEEVETRVIRGLERAIAKSKGLEFGSLLHQLGADFTSDPYASSLHEILLEINSKARGRLPKRRARKRSGSTAESAKRKSGAKKAGDEAPDEAAGAKPKRSGGKKKASEDKPSASRKKAAGNPAETSRKQDAAPEQSAGSDAKKKAAASKKKTAAGKKGDAGTGKSSSAGLSKRKPR
jgi:endonuclease III